jgi:hypothetical protein
MISISIFRLIFHIINNIVDVKQLYFILLNLQYLLSIMDQNCILIYIFNQIQVFKCGRYIKIYLLLC